jgi:hypothetical protein
MPLAYDIDTTSRIVLLTCGNTSLDAWRRCMREVLADPQFRSGSGFLVDCRTATLAPEIADVRGVVDFLSAHSPALGRSRWAVVVEQPAGYGMARMASIRADAAGLELQAFENIEEARAWLLAER